VTSIIKCAAAPGLETWKQNQVLLAALTLPRRPEELDEAFCKRIMADSGEQARKAREGGTQIHAAIQGHYEGKPPSEDMLDHVKGAVRAIRQKFGEFKWVTEKPCAHPLGYGTKADLHSARGRSFSTSRAATLTRTDGTISRRGTSITCSSPPRAKPWAAHGRLRHRVREPHEARSLPNHHGGGGKA
jgi:hypothetical protein